MDKTEFRDLCRSLEGRPYIFGDEGPDSFDCSGLAVFLLEKLEIAPGGRSTRGLHRHFVENGHGTPVVEEDIRLGDLCFYTNAAGAINHVTIGWGDGMVFEAGRGDETTTSVARAEEMDAKVMFSDLNRHPRFKDATRPHGLPW